MCDQGRHNDCRKKAYYQNATIKGTVSRNKYCILSYEWCFRNCFYISKPSLKSCNFCNCRPLYAKLGLLIRRILFQIACYFVVRHWASAYNCWRCATSCIPSMRHANASIRNAQTLKSAQCGESSSLPRSDFCVRHYSGRGKVAPVY